MALPIDRFEHLARNVIELFSGIRDGFAMLGAAFAARKTITSLWQIYQALKVHGISNVIQPNLRQRYGPWAVVTGSTHGIGKAYAQELASCGINIIVISIGEGDCREVAAYIVITGCTGGIGKAYTEELAARGINIVLISRNETKLNEVASQLEKKFKVETHIIPVDFSEGRPVYDNIKKGLEGKEIGILVNNVGVMYDYPNFFLDIPEDKLWQLFNINVAASTMMTHLVLPQMVERGRGAVVMVASSAGNRPTPQIAVYSATKTYLDHFSRALEYEYRSKGITVQCLMPFYVATRMTQYSSTLSNPSLLIPTASTYARHALATLGWSTHTTGYWPHTVQLWFANLIPEWLWLWGGSRLNSALRRQAFQRIRHRSGSKNRSRPSSMVLLS